AIDSQAKLLCFAPELFAVLEKECNVVPKLSRKIVLQFAKKEYKSYYNRYLTYTSKPAKRPTKKP
ncbi:unnamed protein product, partial [marine sediment metagenome]